MSNVKAFLRLALVAATSMPILAQSGPLTYDVKVLGGITAGSLRTDHEDNKALGVAFSARIPLPSGAALLAEVGFDYLPGVAHDAMPRLGPVYYNPTAPTTTYNGQTLWLDPVTSIDWRKERTAGFSLRGGYTDALPILPLEEAYWFAGGSLDLHRTSSEFSGTLIPVYGSGTPVPGYDPVDPNNPGGPKKAYYEGWAFEKSVSKASLGLFAGVGVPINANVKAELTLRNIGFTHQDYHPFTYTGRPAELTQSTGRGWIVQVGIGMKL